MIKLMMILTLGLTFSASLYSAQLESEFQVLGVTLGKSTLKEVKEKFKAQEIYHEGEAETSLSVLCFKSSNGVSVAFESVGVNGAEQVVNTIAINAPSAPYKLNQICEKTSLIKTKIIMNKLSLGMSPDLVKALKGSPAKQETNKMEYKYSSQDKTSALIIEFKDSMSNKMIVSQKGMN